MQHYQRMSARVLERLREICGAEAVFGEDWKQFQQYAHDQVAEKKYAHPPEVVVKPGTAEEIVAIVRLANEERIPITPRGAGSGLSGGAVPLHGGICLSLDRMNRILEIDRDNLVAVVEPGVVTNHLDKELKPYGLFFAGYPMSEEICFVGGNVAENAGGGKAIKYGVTGKHIVGLELVTPTGELLQLGGKRFKDVTGYDLLSLMVGSEGTLGIFTKIFIRLLPRPVSRISTLALFSEVQSAVAMVAAIMTRGRLIPTSIELMDRFCLEETCKDLKETLDYGDAGAALLLEVDGASATQVKEDAEVIRGLCQDNGALQIYTAETEAESERFWRIRKRLPWTLKQISPHQTVEDVVVPIAHIPAIIDRFDAIANKYGIRIPCFGHAGDGNLHATPLKNPDHTDEQWEQLVPEILTEIYRVVAELGGTISGEHGIGHKRKNYLELVMSQAQIEMMRSIKQALDPNQILNPGKIFD